MEDEKTVEKDDEKKPVEETTEQKTVGDDNEAKGLNRDGSEKTTELTDEEKTANVEKGLNEDGSEKSEENPYKQQLEGLEKDKVQLEKDKIQLETENRQKGGALKEEREKNKGYDEKLEEINKKIDGLKDDKKIEKEPLSEDDIDKRFDDKFAKKEVKDGLKEIDNEDERKLTEHHYENSIVKSGDVEKDLKNARALANQHLIEKAREQDIEIDASQDAMTKMSGANSVSGDRGKAEAPIKKAAGQFLDNIGASEAKKHL